MVQFGGWIGLLVFAWVPYLVVAACGTCPLNSICKSTYCSCLSGFVFDCNYPATTPGTNSIITLFPGIASYLLLSSEIEKELGFNINVVLPNGLNIMNTLTATTFIDEGVAVGAVGCSSEFLQPDVNVLNIQTALRLTYQPNTADPEQLVLMLNLTGPPQQNVYISYEVYSLAGNQLFLILGYVAGGLLVAVSIFFIVLLYRKRSSQRQQRQSQVQEEKKPIDISHFETLMPALPITVDARRDVQACSVCLQEFDLDVVVRRTVCHHVFHKECLDEWCLKNLSCPMCRTDLSHLNILKLRVDNAKNQHTSNWVINTLSDQDQNANDQEQDPTSDRPLSLTEPLCPQLNSSITEPLCP